MTSKDTMDSNNKVRTRLVIDCDPGTDDAQSMLMALSHSSIVELLALTTVLGNSSVDNTTRNALRILKFANRLDIPVYRGCSCTVLGGPTVNDAFHGEDGMGDVHIEGVDPVDLSLIQKESAPQALVNLATKYSGQITLVAIGPLTNVAAALAIDEEFGKKLKDCVIMGGSLDGLGNITRTAEFNFYADPEAAQRVLQGFGNQITLIPLDTCITYFPPWAVYDELIARPTRTARFVGSIDTKMLSKVRPSNAEPGTTNGYCAWDQLALAVIIRPDCVLEEKVMTVAVELSGALTRGQTVIGGPRARDTWRGVPDNVRVITKIDERIYHDLLSNTVNFEFS